MDENLPEKLAVYLKQYHTYDELLEKLYFFQSLRTKATALVDDWDFELGK